MSPNRKAGQLSAAAVSQAVTTPAATGKARAASENQPALLETLLDSKYIIGCHADDS